MSIYIYTHIVDMPPALNNDMQNTYTEGGVQVQLCRLVYQHYTYMYLLACMNAN